MVKYYLTSSNHHNTVEFRFVLQSCFYVLPRNTNIMTDKGFNLFDECAATGRSAPIIPEGTVKYTHLAA